MLKLYFLFFFNLLTITQNIRVLIKFDNQGIWLIDKGLFKKYLVTFQDNILKVNGKKIYNNYFKISSSDYNLPIKVNDHYYQGSINFKIHKNIIYLINVLNLEDYVRDVVCAENYKNWPLETYKAQAVAARTYAYYHILNKKNSFYDITASPNIHQAYQGYCDHYLISLASIKHTNGQILYYKDKPIYSMYSSCCGGVIPAKIKNIKLNMPYLKRTYKCDYCSKSSNYVWQKNLTEKELNIKFKDLDQIKSVKILQKDAAGCVLDIQVIGKKNKKLTGDEFRNLLGLKSTCFDLKYKDKVLKINGKGYGHFMGMCQWGAKFMADKNYSYQEILNFYYPGVKIKKLN